MGSLEDAVLKNELEKIDSLLQRAEELLSDVSNETEVEWATYLMQRSQALSELARAKMECNRYIGQRRSGT